MDYSKVIHDLGPLIIFLVITPLVFYFRYRSRKQQTKNLRDLATKLGLQFNDPDRRTVGDVYQQKLASMPLKDRSRAQAAGRRLQQSGILKAIMSLTRPLSVAGKYNGFQVELKLLHQNKKDFTEAAALFAEPLGLGLAVERAGFWNRDLAFSKAAKVESGNPEFDKQMTVRATEAMGAKYIVKNLQCQLALLELFKQKGAKVDDRGATVRQDGHQTEYAKAKKLFDDMTRALQAMAASTGKSVRPDES